MANFNTQRFLIKNKATQRLIIIYFLFLAASIILFWPVLNKNFASDDFGVLYRIVYQKTIFIKSFFRPISDITLYFSYLMGGFNPIYYNVFNIIVHASCTYMLYRFCLMDLGLLVENKSFFAWFSAILFFIYPFHNESIVWVVGRASMMSCFFGFLSLLCTFSTMPSIKKYMFSCIFYFLGLCSYETILPLPAIVLLFAFTNHIPIKKLIPITIAYLITLISNLIIRYLVSGVIWGSYGGQMFGANINSYFIKAFKVFGRLFFPPTNFSALLVAFFIAFILLIATVSIIIIKKNKKQLFPYLKLTIILLISCIVPCMFGISTRTFEGDRLFYFSSFFLCMWISYLYNLCHSSILRISMSVCTIAYFIYFFYQSIFSWKKAGEITTNVLRTIRSIKKEDHYLFLINIPDEYNGAQVFRNGFLQALIINQIDTSKISILNYLSSDDAIKVNRVIIPKQELQSFNIFPTTTIINGYIKVNGKKAVSVKFNSADIIYYWNKEALVPFNKFFKKEK